MPDIAASNVTYTVLKRAVRSKGDNYRVNKVRVQFGNGSLTYPSGGVPLTKGQLGCPNVLKSVIFIDPGSADLLKYKYDNANEKIRIYSDDGASGIPAELTGGSTAVAATTLVVEAQGY